MRVGLILTLALSAIACGPSLRRGEEFKPQRVREVMFNDECRLQSHFDAQHPAPKLLTQQNVSTDPRFAAGEATFVISHPANVKAFWGLMAHLYKRIPPLPAKAKKIEVHTRYHLIGGRSAMPINAETRVEAGELELELPYHPCVGAFFYRREYYRIRAKMQPR